MPIFFMLAGHVGAPDALLVTPPETAITVPLKVGDARWCTGVHGPMAPDGAILDSAALPVVGSRRRAGLARGERLKPSVGDR